MKYTSVFGSKVFVSAADLAGREVSVRIARVDLEDVPNDAGEKQPKLVITFDGKGKKLILNLTNAKTLATLAGSDDTDRWSGLSVVLYPIRTTYKGKEVDGIRMRGGAAAPAFAAPDPDLGHDSIVDDDDAPF